MRRPGKRILRYLAGALVLCAIVAGVAFAWYVGDYHHADEVALSDIRDLDGQADGVTVSSLAGGDVAFLPERAPVAGLIFYPGGKVEADAYAPLLTEVARRGVACVLIRFPANLAFLDVDAAARVPQELPGISEWILCGHSLGGVAASAYAATHADDLAAIVFLASYPTSDLTSFPGKVLSVIGTNDLVLRRDAYEEAKRLLPPQAQELVIEGANHSGFGNYGKQDGDGMAEMDRTEQQALTAAAIVDLVGGTQG